VTTRVIPPSDLALWILGTPTAQSPANGSDGASASAFSYPATDLVVPPFPTNDPEIAVSSGFNDQAYLTRVFKRRLGITPRQYCLAPWSRLAYGRGTAAGRAKCCGSCEAERQVRDRVAEPVGLGPRSWVGYA
jgi:Bacterial regulatory helix-turn-helix proteins, AraC family